MNDYENEIFEFGNENIDEVEKPSNNFNYNSISGLGESNYENDDLFKNENISNDIDNHEENQSSFNFGVEDDNNKYLTNEFENNNTDSEYNNNIFEEDADNYNAKAANNYIAPMGVEENSEATLYETPIEIPIEYQDNLVEDNKSADEANKTFGEQLTQGLTPNVETEENDEISEPAIEMSETPIEELQSLTDYEDDKIEKMDINALFDKVSVNVKGASEIFKRNTEMKEKIDSRFEELKKLQSEVENSKKTQIDEINNYKDEVFNKLTEKKEEIEKRLNTLKDLQATLEKEKTEFEIYKKREQENIEKIQKEVQSAYDDRREELGHIEDTLRKQKDALDEERNQLSLDKIQYEADKNDLANNILKFNELVDSFTNGVNGVTES